LNDTTTPTSGNRWEPPAGTAPLLPPEQPPSASDSGGGSGGGSGRWAALRDRGARHPRAWLAGGVAAVLLASGFGGFAVGRSTAPEGDRGTSLLQRDGRHGFPGDDRFSDEDGFAPPSGQPPTGQGQQAPSTDGGSHT